MTVLKIGYQIRLARIEELPLLSGIEQSAARLFLDTPYAFLVNDNSTLDEYGWLWMVVR
jgi:hypothetical protein